MGSSTVGGGVQTNKNTIQDNRVFVYGSLQAEEVVQVLLKRIPSSCPAILKNYHRFSIKGRVYPAIIPLHNSKVTGKLLSGITAPELEVLDAFEDNEYERRLVDVSLMDKPEKLQACTYVWSDSTDPNLYGEWDFEEWKKLHMKDFVKMTMSFTEELEQLESKQRLEACESYNLQNDEKSPTP